MIGQRLFSHHIKLFHHVPSGMPLRASKYQQPLFHLDLLRLSTQIQHLRCVIFKQKKYIFWEVQRSFSEKNKISSKNSALWVVEFRLYQIKENCVLFCSAEFGELNATTFNTITVYKLVDKALKYINMPKDIVSLFTSDKNSILNYIGAKN